MMSTPWKKWTAALTVALFLALTVMPAWAAAATLKQGSRGQAVTELQQNLNALGYSAGEADGIYGGNTANAVKAFQRDNGLTADGIVGPATQSAIDLKMRSSGSAAGSTGDTGTITAGVNVRAEAKSGSTILGTLSKGTKVTVLGISGSWVHVKSGSLTGYVFEDYIDVNQQAGGSSDPVIEEESFTGTVKVSGSLNVRKGPGTSYASVGKLYNGDKVTVTGSTGDWYVISFNGGTGYVSSAYITKNGSTATPTAKPESFTGTVKVSGSLNVRKGPGTSYASVGKLYNGDKVTVTGSTGDWYVISFNGGTGYVSSAYITKGGAQETATPTAKPESFTGTVKVSGSLNVRKGPGTSYASIGKLYNGDKVTVTGSSGSWYVISFNGGTGYVSSAYITKGGTQETATPTAKPESFTGTVKVSGSLNVRKGPGTNYTAIGKLYNGDKVTVTGSSGSWYAISFSGSTGYVSSAYIVKDSDSQETPGGEEDSEGYVLASALNVRSGPGTNYNILGKLYSGDLVEIVGSTNGWYKIDYNGGTGYVSAGYIQKGPPPEDVPPSSNEMLTKDLDIDTTLKVGSTGSKVKDLQTALNMQGFYSGAIDGIYDSEVQSAVKSFQKAAGLDADGVAGNYTLATVYTLLDPIPKSQLNLKAYDNGSSIPIIKPTWSEANNLLPRGATFTIVDVRTGYTYRAVRTGGSLHADTEPATRVDTNIMFQAVGSKWSWTRRPIWVVYNGIRMAASMNCQPHGFETIGGNDMTGQFCIHFVGSKTHGSNSVDAAHQSCIDQAYRAGQ